MPNKYALAKTIAASAASEAAGIVPGGSTALSLIQHIFTSRTKTRAEELFRAIGVQLGADDWEEAAAQMGKYVGTSWFDEAIEAGFLELMSATDPEARACLGALVAEYVVNKRPLDLKFKRVGALLRDSDVAMLPTLWAVATSYMAILPHAGSGMRVLIRSTRRPETPTEFFVGAYVSVPRGFQPSTRYPMVDNFQECARALVGAGIGNQWSGLSDSAFEGAPVIYFEHGEDDVLALLSTCLKAWIARRQQSTPLEKTPEDGT